MLEFLQAGADKTAEGNESEGVRRAHEVPGSHARLRFPGNRDRRRGFCGGPAGGGGCGRRIRKAVRRGQIRLNAREKETFLLHNEERQQRNSKPFCVHPKLQRAARAHSEDMIRRDYFSHNTEGGGTFSQRLKRFGYKGSPTAENIAWGAGPHGEPKSRMNAWMDSTGHRSNILDNRFREIGIGIRTGTYEGYEGAIMYTVDFGIRR